MNIFTGRIEHADTRVDRVEDRFDGPPVLSCRARGEEAGVYLMQGFLMNIPLPAPGRTRHALRVQDEWKVLLGTWK